MRAITPFRRGQMWWARVPRVQHDAVQRSLGVEDGSEAKEICRFLEWLRGRGARSEWLLEQLATRKGLVVPAYSAYVQNRLDAYEKELRDGITDIDLEPFVAMWQKELARRKRPNEKTRRKYLLQVRTLIEEGTPFRRSAFTRQRLRQWLTDLPVEQPNRYRSAMSSFAQFLLLEGVIDVNPARLVPMVKESEPRTNHLSPDDALRLVGALEQPAKALHALMIATGMELGAALALRAGDVRVLGDLPDATGVMAEVYARGTKRIHRQRTVTVYSTWAAVWEAFAGWFDQQHFPAEAKPFDGIHEWTAYRALKRGLAAVKQVAEYTVHDHRHTWAVQAVRDGLALHTIAHQLGHRDATMVLQVYGRYVPTASDFSRRAIGRAVSATSVPPQAPKPEGPDVG